MIKKMYLATGVVVLLCLVGLTGCGTNKNTFDGKYTDVGDSSIYYELSKDGTYTTNNPGEDMEGVPFSDYGTYSIENGEVILFAGDDPDDPEFTYYMGYVYKDTICSKWEGELPSKKQDFEIFVQPFEQFSSKYQFNENGEYEYTVTGENNKLIIRKKGVYNIEKNKVTCEDDDGLIDTFYSTEDGIYRVDFIKE